jgi:hypothetical protein
MTTFEVIRGRVRRGALDEATAWANVAENRLLLLSEWRRLNEGE